MLHEIFFAMLGSPANLLNIINGEKLSSGSARLHPCEMDFLGRIVVISKQYQTLKTFVDMHKLSRVEKELKILNQESKNSSVTVRGVESEDSIEFGEIDTSHSEQHPGIYLQAFCCAVGKALQPYRNSIVAMEKKALKNQTICPFTYIVSEAEQYTGLFQLLNNIISQIEIQNIRGCAIVNYLQTKMLCGSYEVVTVLESILRECQAVMMVQISRWLLYGYLVDFHQEFFIVDAGRDRSSSYMEANTTNTTHSSRLKLNKTASTISCDVSINFEMLPSCIRPSVAEKILYVGKMIMLFREDPKNVTKLGFQSQAPKLSIWGDEEDQYFLKLNAMCKTETLDELEFASVIDEIRATVVERTWQYFVEDTNLFEEIHLMKDFFLLGRGELFLEFLYKTDGIRNRRCYRHEMDKNCREAFIMAAHQVMFTDELVLKKFSIHFPFNEYVGTDCDLFKEKDGWWHILNLKYIPKWPMHLIFTPSIIQNYNKLFNFLMRVKKAQRDLHEIWRDHMQQRSKLFSTSVSARVWQLRNNLMFMINNLQYYLQVDVLESQFTELETKMHASRDFEEIIRVHSLFQARIMSQSFLSAHKEALSEDSMAQDEQEAEKTKIGSKNVIHDILLTIIALTDKFCKTVSGSITSLQQKTLDSVLADFEFNVSFLLRYMQQMQGHTSGVYVSQLYMRLNYNEWFSKTLNMRGTLVNPNIIHK